MERGRCDWVTGTGRCRETEDLVRHQPKWSQPRLLCPKHLAELLKKERAAASARP